MHKDYQIASLWIGDSLSFLEQLSLQSFMSVGYHVKLYQYEPVQNVPEGVELADANEIFSSADYLIDNASGSVANHSDRFRYKLLEKNRYTIWVDMDTYCIKQYDMTKGQGEFLFAVEGPGLEIGLEHMVGAGVLLLPQDSETLGRLLEFVSDEYSIPTWHGDEYTRKLEEARDRGEPVHVSQQPWAVWSSRALSYFLQETGEIKYALPKESFYPQVFNTTFYPHFTPHGDFSLARVDFRRILLSPSYDTTGVIKENTYSLHLFGSHLRYYLAGNPKIPEESLLGRALRREGIDPSRAPVKAASKPPRIRITILSTKKWILLLAVLFLTCAAVLVLFL